MLDISFRVITFFIMELSKEEKQEILNLLEVGKLQFFDILYSNQHIYSRPDIDLRKEHVNDLIDKFKIIFI